MPFVQGKFDEDLAGIHYEDSKAATPNEDSEAAISNLEFPPAESQDPSLVPDLAFPPVEAPDPGIVDLEFPSTGNVAVQQPLVDENENENVGVLSRIRGWFR